MPITGNREGGGRVDERSLGKARVAMGKSDLNSATLSMEHASGDERRGRFGKHVVLE